MSSLIDEAAEMSLLDGAYALWRARRRLDAQERTQVPVRRRGVRPGPSAAFAASVQAAIQAAREERARAHEGPTFDRLKLAHPEASDANLREAIRAAVKLETDGNRHFSYKHQDYWENVVEAVRLARLDNPGFSEITYKHLLDDIAFAMK